MDRIEPILLITALLIIVATGIIMLVLVYQKKQMHYLREKEGLQQKFEKEMLESQLEIKEQTFKEVSQELHDNVAQVLTMAKLNLSTINLDVAELAKAKEKIDNAKECISNAIQDLRDLSKTMDIDLFANLGLEQAIKDELKKLERVGAIETKFELIGEPIEIEPKKEIILFRVVQEAIQNVVKHSEASCLSIKIDYRMRDISLIVSDNGKGFDTNNLIKGNGMINMANRCKVIGAHCNIGGGTSHSGTCITIRMPSVP